LPLQKEVSALKSRNLLVLPLILQFGKTDILTAGIICDLLSGAVTVVKISYLPKQIGGYGASGLKLQVRLSH